MEVIFITGCILSRILIKKYLNGDSGRALIRAIGAPIFRKALILETTGLLIRAIVALILQALSFRLSGWQCLKQCRTVVQALG